MEHEIRTRSTSKKTAEASPIVLRETTRGRLVFKPTVISDNPKNPKAYVNGIFAFQTKTPSQHWRDMPGIKLNALKAGEGVRLNLSSEEVHDLYVGLCELYQIAEEQGVKPGVTEFIPAPKNARIKELVKSAELNQLSHADQADLLSTFIGWLNDMATAELSEKLAAAPGEVANFDAALGAARLKFVLREMNANEANDSEAYWDHLFTNNTWVLSQLYAEPLIVIQGQPYVGGKAVTNRGGSLADYLFANPFTTNPSLIEIKTPTAPLLRKTPYRGTGAFQPSEDLTGAVAQAVHNRDTLKENYRNLAGAEDPSFRAFHPRALVIIGDLQQEGLNRTQHRSFELYRGSLRDVDIVTFDEVRAKADQLLALLAA